jgi:ribosomal protein S18 acetylase RimI-like enzyme
MAEVKSIGLIGQLFVQLLSANLNIADGKKRAYIHGVRVKPMYRNQGVGTLLMETAEKDLSNRGFTEVTLNVVKTNQAALRWYKRLGYIVIGSDPGEWNYIDHRGVLHHVKEPAWKMIKILSYPPNMIK